MIPETSTGRKVLAIHGSQLLDDILGIEAEASECDPRLLALALETTTLLNEDDAQRWSLWIAQEYDHLASVERRNRP